MSAAGSAEKIDTVYDVLLICSVPVFVLVMTVAIYSVVRFRAKPGDMRDGAPIHGNTRLEVIWVTIPFLMVTALAIYGWIMLDDLEAKQPERSSCNVTGQQFTWTFEYPSEKVTVQQLVLPKDRPVEFRIHTKDVLHSFWVPEFRLKSDAVPGPDHQDPAHAQTGSAATRSSAPSCAASATRRCARTCASCARADFDAWLARAEEGRARSGRRRGTAAARPEVAAEAAAPTARRSSRRTAAAAATRSPSPRRPAPSAQTSTTSTSPTAAFIRQSITDPNKVVTKGFQPDIMPQDFGDKLSPDELDALVEYLLKAQK